MQNSKFEKRKLKFSLFLFTTLYPYWHGVFFTHWHGLIRPENTGNLQEILKPIHMRKITHFILSAALAIGTLASGTAQTLLKDLKPGPHPASSNPEQFMKVGNSMFFLARAQTGSLFNHQLWVTDGTTANTVMLKDSLIVTNLGDRVKLRADLNGVLYFTVTPETSSPFNVQLWKSDGTVAGTSLVTTLSYSAGTTGGSAPNNFVQMGSKLYFNFGQLHGRELWVTDGTAAGTMEVIDLDPSTSGGYQLSGLTDEPMIVYNGKIYFAGSTNFSNFELFSSDGTSAGTALVYDLRPGSGSAQPKGWKIWNNELYFYASDGSADNLWKTDGTTTTKLSTGINAGNLIVFKNQLFFTAGGSNLWTTDGTVGGTVMVSPMASNSGFIGANDDYLFALNNSYISTPPYIVSTYLRTDGTAGGVSTVPYNVGSSASFSVVDNKMYKVRLDSGSTSSVGLWVTDGTTGGTSKLFNGYGTGYEYVYHDTVYFANYTSAVGYEPFYWVPTIAGISNSELNTEVSIYPNPSNGIVNIVIEGSNSEFQLEVYDVLGKKIRDCKNVNAIDLSNAPKGIYFLRVSEGNKSFTKKIILQ
jgi:ELWxxDGT repeat protein